jgi:hypothetical protein
MRRIRDGKEWERTLGFLRRVYKFGPPKVKLAMMEDKKVSAYSANM